MPLGTDSINNRAVGSFGKRLEDARKSRGATQNEATAAAGLSPGYWSRLKSQRKDIRSDTAEVVASALRVSREWLVLGTGAMDLEGEPAALDKDPRSVASRVLRWSGVDEDQIGAGLSRVGPGKGAKDLVAEIRALLAHGPIETASQVRVALVRYPNCETAIRAIVALEECTEPEARDAADAIGVALDSDEDPSVKWWAEQMRAELVRMRRGRRQTGMVPVEDDD